MNRPDQDLSGFLVQPRSEADLGRYWDRLAKTMAEPQPRRGGWAMAVASLALVGAAVVLIWLRQPNERLALPGENVLPPRERLTLVVEGAVHSNVGTVPQILLLADGSHITLAPGSVVSLARSRQDDLRLVLERGSAAFDVAHVQGRRFAVAAADVDVVVVGTRFVVTVSKEPDQEVTTLSVETGVVEVRRAAMPTRRLLSGESWSSRSATPAVAPPEVPKVPSSPPAPPSRAVAAPPPERESLFEAATRARLRGDHRQAAKAFERFFQRYPTDARAPLAAFQLGRIQLDTFHDAVRAAESFRATVRLTRDPGLKETAAARVVEALDQSSDVSACRAARNAYRAAYPTGPHLGRVTAYCRDR